VVVHVLSVAVAESEEPSQSAEFEAFLNQVATPRTLSGRPTTSGCSVFGVEICLLGPLEVLDDRGTRIEVPGTKLRALLSVLALRPGEVVSTDRLIDELWGSDTRSTRANSRQQLVSKLRRLLPEDVLATRPPGYALDVPADSVDVDRFDSLVLRGRKELAGGDFDVAIDAFEQALALWRGPALDEFRYEDFAQEATRRLDEERASVQEDLVDARPGVGGGSDLVAELEAAVAREPLRERRRGQLMLALYRAGRQADALRQYQEPGASLGRSSAWNPVQRSDVSRRRSSPRTPG
jgi:DNA-binding SARP family transcriptional activator